MLWTPQGADPTMVQCEYGRPIKPHHTVLVPSLSEAEGGSDNTEKGGDTVEKGSGKDARITEGPRPNPNPKVDDKRKQARDEPDGPREEWIRRLRPRIKK